MEASGSFWEHLGASGSIWKLLGASGSFWDLLEDSGFIFKASRNQMLHWLKNNLASGSSWEHLKHLGADGTIGLLDASGSLWEHSGPSGRLQGHEYCMEEELREHLEVSGSFWGILELLNASGSFWKVLEASLAPDRGFCMHLSASGKF